MADEAIHYHHTTTTCGDLRLQIREGKERKKNVCIGKKKGQEQSQILHICIAGCLPQSQERLMKFCNVIIAGLLVYI